MQHLSESTGSKAAVHAAHLSESTGSKAAVEGAVHALSWLHGLAGLQPFGGLPLVQATLEGLRCTLAKPKARKEPITSDMLSAMVEATGQGTHHFRHVECHGGGHWARNPSLQTC